MGKRLHRRGRFLRLGNLCAAFVITTLTLACGSLREGSTDADAASLSAALPQLSALSAQHGQLRQVTAQQVVQLGDGDMLKSVGATWQDDVLQLGRDWLSFAVLGVDAADSVPAALALDGNKQGVYVLQANYATSRWELAGGQLDGAGVAELPLTGGSGDTGLVCLAIVCLPGCAANVRVALSFSDPEPVPDYPAWGIWEPGDRIVMSWDDPQIDWTISIATPGPTPKLGYPGYPQDTLGMLTYSEDSAVSGEALEWMQLLPDAPPGAYMFSIGVPGEPQGVSAISMRIEDGQGHIKQSLGSLDCVLGDYHVGYFAYNLAEPPQETWQPLDSIEMASLSYFADWQYADCDLIVTDPQGHSGSARNPAELEGIIAFTPLLGGLNETAQLLPGAPHGAYVLEVAYLSDSNDTELAGVALRLYEYTAPGGGHLKSHLNMYHFACQDFRRAVVGVLNY